MSLTGFNYETRVSGRAWYSATKLCFENFGGTDLKKLEAGPNKITQQVVKIAGCINPEN